MKLSNCDDRFKMDAKLETSLTDKKINVTLYKRLKKLHDKNKAKEK